MAAAACKTNRPPGSLGGLGGGLLVDDSGDNRLSRQRHYHGPGGLNGRVRNGNGCDPASMVAGNSPGRRSGRPGRDFGGSVTHEGTRHSSSNRDPVITADRRPLARRRIGMRAGGPIGVVKLLGC